MPPRDNPSQRQPSVSLGHANSTKKLIDRYESLNHGSLRVPLEPPKGSKRPVKKTSRIFSGISLREKAPIRESFRNLWSALKKARPSVKDKDDTLSVQEEENLISRSSLERAKHHKTRTGSLMYLSYAAGPQGLWVDCQTTLAPDHLLLVINSEQKDATEHRIYLSECSDVRSLALGQLNPSIRRLLPSEGQSDDIKPFELSFDGRRGEKFFADSVQGRAQWVGAIWDTILRLQEKEKNLLQRTSSIISATEYVTKPRQTQRKPTTLMNHSLPPVPLKDSLPPLPLEMALSVSSYPISRGVSHNSTSSPPTPCAKSPLMFNSCLPSAFPSRSQPIEEKQESATDSILDAYGDALDALESTKPDGLKPPPQVRYQLYDPPLPPIPKRSSYISVHSENEPIEDVGLPAQTTNDSKDVAPLNTSKHPPFIEELSSVDISIRQDIEAVAKMTLQVRDSVDAVQEQLGANVPLILTRLEDLRSALLAFQKNDQDKELSAVTPTSLNDMTNLGGKLDHLLAIVSQTTTSREGKQDLDSIKEEVKTVKVLLESIQQKQVAQGTQAVDSARYLNDLNKWLEIFVNQGISQIQGVMTNIQYLNHALGVNTEDKVPRSIVIDELRQLVAQQSTVSNPGSMQATVETLTGHLNAHHQSSVTRTQEMIAGLIEQQRHNQEILLKNLTAELSSEIRGERLRFVEAMKEATQINVQGHVEQFKKELTREVRELTQEVGRLHQERQTVENQIADLFAFYQKQTKSSSGAQLNVVPGQVMLNPYPPLQAVQNLPLHHYGLNQ